MKRIFWAIPFLLTAPMFGAITMELDLNANGTLCSVMVNTGAVITTVGTCANLTTSVTADHGELTVATKPGLLFGGIAFNSTSDGHDFVTVPQLQNQDQTQASSTIGGFFRTTFTDTSLTTPAQSFGVTTTLNALTLGGTGDFDAFSDNTNGIPAISLFGTKLGQAGPSTSTFSVDANLSPGATYSLTSRIVINFLKKNQAVTASQQISAVNVPEPASIMLMGSMLLLTSLGLRRKMTRG